MNGIIAPIAKIWCYFVGNATLAAILASVAVVGLIIMFIVDEGNSFIFTVIRILLGAVLLVTLPALLQHVFGINLCTHAGG